MEFDEAVIFILENEGGYVKDPDDSGGETKFGISKRSYPNLNIKDLTKEQAKTIYWLDYWLKINGDNLPDHIRLSVFDFAVNAGVVTAVKMLQRLAGVKQDGKVGPVTCEAAKKISVTGYANARIRYYNNLVKKRPKDKRFISGWRKRTFDIVETSNYVNKNTIHT